MGIFNDSFMPLCKSVKNCVFLKALKMIKKISMMNVLMIAETSSYAMDDACPTYPSGFLLRSPASIRSAGGGTPERSLTERIQLADDYRLPGLLDEALKIPGPTTSKHPYAMAFFEKFKQSQSLGSADRYSKELQFRVAQYLFRYGRSSTHDVSLNDYGCSILIFSIQKGAFDFSFDRGIILSIRAYIQSLKENIEHELFILRSRGDTPDMTPLPSERSYGSQIILSDLATIPLLYLLEIVRNKFTLNGEAPNSFDTRLKAAQILLDKALAL